MIAQSNCPKQDHLHRKVQKLRSHLETRPSDQRAIKQLMDLEIALFNEKNGLNKNRKKSRKPRARIDKITPVTTISRGEPGTPKHSLKPPVPIAIGAEHILWSKPVPRDKTKTSKRTELIAETEMVLCSPAWLEVKLPCDPDSHKSIVNYFAKNFDCNVRAYIELWVKDAFDNNANRARDYITGLIPLQWDCVADIVKSVNHANLATSPERPIDVDPIQDQDTKALNKLRLQMQQRVRDMVAYHLMTQITKTYDKYSNQLSADFCLRNGTKTSFTKRFEPMCRSYLTNLMRQTCAKQSAENSRLLRNKAEDKLSKALESKSERQRDVLIAQAEALIAKAEMCEQTPAVAGFPMIADNPMSLEDAREALDNFCKLLESDDIIGNHVAVNELRSVVQSATARASRQVVRGWERNHNVVAKGMVSQRQQASLVYNLKSQTIEMVVACGENGVKHNLDDLVYLDGEPLSIDNQILPTQKTHVLTSVPRHDFVRWYNKHIENHDAAAPAHKRAFCRSFQFVIVTHKRTRQTRMFVRPIFNFAIPKHGYVHFEKGHQFRYYIGLDLGINNVFYSATYDSQNMTVIDQKALEHDKIHRLKTSREIAKLQSQLDSGTTLSQATRNRLYKTIGKLRRQLRDLKTPIRKAVSEMVSAAEKTYGRGNYCFVLEGINPNAMFGAKNMARVRHATAMGFVQESLVAQMAKLGYQTFEYDGKLRMSCVKIVSAYGTSKITPSGHYLEENTDEMYGRNIGRVVSRVPNQNGDYPVGQLVKIPHVKYKVLHVDEAPHVDWGQELLRDVDGVVYNADYVAAVNLAIRPSVQLLNPELSKKELCEMQAKFMSGVKILCNPDVYEIANTDTGQVLRKRESAVTTVST